MAVLLMMPPRIILQSLCGAYLSTRAVIEEVYNIQTKLIKDRLAGANPNEAIIAQLRISSVYTFDAKIDADGRLK